MLNTEEIHVFLSDDISILIKIFKDKENNFNYIIEKLNNDYYPKLMIIIYLDFKKISFLKKKNFIKLDNAKIIENIEEFISKNKELFLDINFHNDKNKVIIEIEVLEHDIIKKYVEEVVLCTLEYSDKYNVKNIFNYE